MRARHSFLGGCVIIGAAVAGCYTGPSQTASAPTTTSAPTEPETVDMPDPDLPCDVASVLSSSCGSCHGTTLHEAAPHHYLSVADLTKAAPGDPGHTMAELCVARMQSDDKPMPPTGKASADAVAIIQKWIDDGYPTGTCGVHEIDYTVDAVCTSNTKWTRGDRGSELMHPGDTCISCHDSSNEGPLYSVAGTLFPTAHEPTDCNGLNGGTKIKVVITDATGKAFTLTPNSAGNFFSGSSMKKPLRAKVVRGDETLEMMDDIKDGDCNSCHTAEGTTDDPTKPRGRIVLP